MLSQCMPAVRVTLALTVVTGIFYPALVTGLAKAIFPHEANGSLLEAHGKITGSELIGQKFTKPEYFQGRPSAAGDGYDDANSGGTNLGPTNPKLADRVKADAEKFRRDNPDFSGSIPSDLLTTSASGFDPDLSPASALAQAPRVAKTRGVARNAMENFVTGHITGRQLGFLGEARVNVLKLNMDLDRFYPMHR